MFTLGFRLWQVGIRMIVWFGYYKISSWLLTIAFTLLLTADVLAQASTLVLISEAEASRPKRQMEFKDSLERGPKVRLIAPSNGAVHSPLRFVIQFQSFGGRAVDPQSVKVTYLTNPAVDLTARLQPYINSAGIEVDAALVPAGMHPLQIELKDNEGHFGSAEINLIVE